MSQLSQENALLDEKVQNNCKKICIYQKKAVILHAFSRSGAVGSALRSGRRGRVFESRLLDKMDIRRCPFLFRRLDHAVFLSRYTRTIIASAIFSSRFARTIIAKFAIFESRLLDKMDIRRCPFLLNSDFHCPKFRISKSFVDIPNPVGGDDDGDEDDCPNGPFAHHDALEGFGSAPAVNEQPCGRDNKEEDE